MPKLKGMESKVLFGKQVDKENENVFYSDAEHVYMDKQDGSPYISVTQLIGRYCQDFDEDFWSSYKALEYLLTPEEFKVIKPRLLQTKKFTKDYLDLVDKDKFEKKKQEIKDEYAKKRNEACERGTAIHAKMENALYAKDKQVINKYAGGGTFEVTKGYYKFDKERAIYPEILISYKFDDYLKVSGQIDCMIKDGNEINLIDFKTNSKIDMESYFNRNTKKHEMMKHPLSNIQDSNFWHYTLQLSLYAYLLQKINPKFKIKKLAIIHFDHDGNEVEYPVEYLKEDVARMLLHYRKEQKIKMELDKDKPIVF